MAPYHASGRTRQLVERTLDPADVARIAGTYHAWRGDGDAPYADVPGFCRAAPLSEIREHGHVLTPGRYVGTETLGEETEDFYEKMDRLLAMLSEQFNDARRLDAMIEARFEALRRG
ncbi:MAG: N-6 DNA methylase [Bryobacteraceae bacterium]|nr:N-6 DNA methylase [Bryobacteraceae bacterium]